MKNDATKLAVLLGFSCLVILAIVASTGSATNTQQITECVRMNTNNIEHITAQDKLTWFKACSDSVNNSHK